MTRSRPLLLLAIPAATLAVGLGLLWQGLPAAASLCFAGGTGVVLAVLLVVIIRSLGRGAFGLDVIAALSMGGALAVGEMLAGNVVALMFAGGQVLEALAQGRAEREMTALLARQPRSARRLGPDGITEVPLEQVAPGDRLLVRGGDVVPVDGTVESSSAVLDEAALTGESVPLRRAAGQPVMSGSTNVGPAFDMVAVRPAADSTYAAIVRLVEAAQSQRSPMARMADRWGLGFLAITVALAGGTWLATHDAVRTLAVLVIATPCPLILAVPVAIVGGLSRCAAHGVLVKTGAALEAMARARVLLIDKTGTLTAGTPTVAAVEGTLDMAPDVMLALAASLAQASPHVMSAALVEQARARGLPLRRAEAVQEDHGAGLAGRVEGHAVVLGGLSFVVARVGEGAGLRGAREASAPPRSDEVATLADAALGPGQSVSEEDGAARVHVGVDGRYAGSIVMVDERRPEAAGVLDALKQAGIARIVLVSGDREAVARAVVEGLPVDRLVAGTSPGGKVDVVAEERAGGVTLMVGDGVNDAPALAAADVGIAMGARGAAASAEAADVVILQDSLDRLPVALRVARRARRIAWQSVVAGMGLSTLGMLAAAAGLLSPLAGALLQEAIDVTVILNALRVLADE